jgi:prepilin-type N-terminal cleavage/methylation domain-containing protein
MFDVRPGPRCCLGLPVRDWKSGEQKYTTCSGQTSMRTTRGSGFAGVFCLKGLRLQPLGSRMHFGPGMRIPGTFRWLRAGRGGFSFIELIGVLAILAILAALLLPRITNRANPARVVGAVNQAQVAQVLASIQAIKTAAAEHHARFGSLASRNGTPFAVPANYDHYDSILLSEQLLDRPFQARLGTGATVRLVNVSGRSVAHSVGFADGAYDLDGRGAGLAGASYVLEAVISGVSENEARALNDALDGPALGANPGEDDFRGQVTYRGGGPAQPREVHIYITQQ